MKKIIILISIICPGKNSFAVSKEVIAIVTRADSFLHEGENIAAIELYRKAQSQDSTIYHNIYNLACAYAQNRQIDSSFKYLALAMQKNTTEQPLADPDFLPLHMDSRWAGFENKLIAQIQKKYEHPISDESYTKALLRLHALDQAYYRDINLAEKRMGRNSSIVFSLWDLKSRINDETQKELEILINKKGWPKISNVRNQAASAAFLIIQHADLDKQKKYLPVIKKYCEEGEAEWQSYALMYDRVQVSQNKPQKYGSQVHFNPLTNKEELYPLEDDTKVNEYRKAAGMGSLEDYLMNWNIKWEPQIKK
ncbi:MAG: DUF6624 domain-containing protein [Chitinophagaceae bacterium]|jgi:hypothetical protein